MERTPIHGSSNVVSAGYDPAANVMEVEFQRNAVYTYGNVTHEMWVSFLNAPSKGGWIAENLRRRANLHPPQRIQ